MGFSPSIYTPVIGRFLWWRPHSLQLSVSITVTWMSEAWSLSVFTNTCFYLDLFLSFLWPQTLLFEYLQLLFYTLLISSKTLCSILLGHVTLHFILHFHQAAFPQITICLIVYCCCSVAKLCLTLCDAMDCRPPGSSVCEISQARTLEWVAIVLSYHGQLVNV